MASFDILGIILGKPVERVVTDDVPLSPRTGPLLGWDCGSTSHQNIHFYSQFLIAAFMISFSCFVSGLSLRHNLLSVSCDMNQTYFNVSTNGTRNASSAANVESLPECHELHTGSTRKGHLRSDLCLLCENFLQLLKDIKLIWEDI